MKPKILCTSKVFTKDTQINDLKTWHFLSYGRGKWVIQTNTDDIFECKAFLQNHC